MSSYRTGRTSTTPSSTSSPSRPDPAGSPAALAVISCGALTAHIREIATRRGWPVEVHSLPALLHNRPAAIASAARQLALALQARGLKVALAYADCGSYGALDRLGEELGIPRLPGLHCYDVFAGQGRVQAMFESEPGTYLLTDFLVRGFRRTVLAELGLDRHPELWPDYFGHYRRLVWLAQSGGNGLAAAAADIARMFGLPLTRVDVGVSELERHLASLLAGLTQDLEGFAVTGDADPSGS